MNPFSVVLLGVIFFIVLKYKNIKKQYIAIVSLLISFDIFISIGYFVKIGTYEITYTEVLLVIALIYSIYFTGKIGIPKKALYIGGLLIGSVLLTESLLAINPLNQLILRNRDFAPVEFSVYSLMISLRIFLIVTLVLNWNKLFNEDDFLFVAAFVHKFGRIIILICFFELISKNLLSSSIFVDITGRLFGVANSTITFIFKRAGTYTLQGLAKEPSILARGLFYYLIILVLTNKFKKIKWDVLASVIILFLSGSFSSVLYICAVVAYQFFNIKTKKRYLLFIPLIIIVGIFINTEIGSYYFMRLQRSFLFFLDSSSIEAMRSTSEASRFNTIFYTFSLWLKKPFFGIGLGVPYSYSYLSTLFASVGSVGALLWYYFVFHSVTKQNFKTYKYIIILLFVWLFAESMGVMYSALTIYIAFLIEYKGKNRVRNKEIRCVQ